MLEGLLRGKIIASFLPHPQPLSRERGALDPAISMTLLLQNCFLVRQF
jgi:hypothetical protein